MKLFTIGCSFTEGQGLKKQSFECYTTKLGEKLNLEFFNFGAAGLSNDYIFRKVFELINSNIITKEDILLIQWTHYMRKELPIVYNDKKLFHSVPNSFHVYEDKIIKDWGTTLSVQNEYIGQNLDFDMKIIESENKKILENYILNFLQTDYQINTTKNYINALYTYLEYNGFKHIHFFGWDECIIESVFEKKTNFLKESFGNFTSTIKNNHPNKKGHESWAHFLFEKIMEFNFINIFDFQIANYRKELFRLHAEIEIDIDNTNQKIKIEQQKYLDKEMEKLKELRLKKLQEELKKDELELNKIKNEYKKQIDLENEKLKALFKPKTLL